MAVHELCPRDKDRPIEECVVAGTALFATRCKNLEQGRCMSDGQTPGSLYQYCAVCSQHYQICEVCGEPLG